VPALASSCERRAADLARRIRTTGPAEFDDRDEHWWRDPCQRLAHSPSTVPEWESSLISVLNCDADVRAAAAVAGWVVRHAVKRVRAVRHGRGVPSDDPAGIARGVDGADEGVVEAAAGEAKLHL